jgi:hypothetical protein
MHTKLIAVTVGLVLAVAGLASSAAAARSSCPEAWSACQPTGTRVPGQDRRGSIVFPRATPKPVDSSGQVWRTGNHLMY